MVFKMRDYERSELPSLFNARAVFIYIKYKKHLKMNKEIGMILPKKELIQVE